MEELVKQIEQLKKEKNAVILAHYYVDDEVQAIADYVGDSYYLAKVATKVEADTICFCGVSFMGESAKILNPEKNVIMPDLLADCPMAHMVELGDIKKMREQYEDLAVVCYINSTAEIKTYSDVCVTSSNAMRIVEKLPEKNIYFIPDENLGRYIANQMPEKNFILNPGFCHVHTSIDSQLLAKAKESHKAAKVLAHPECKTEILEQADFIGSTSEIIDFATEDDGQEFIIATEMGVLYELQQKNKDKKFYSVGHRQFCPNMKRITLEKVKDCLEQNKNQVEVSEEVREQALVPLNRMLELAK